MTNVLPPAVRWITLVRVPIVSFTVLRARRREEPVQVKVAIRFASLDDLPMAFKIRGTYRAVENQIVLGWFAQIKHRRKPRTSYVDALGYKTLEMGDCVVLCKGFVSELDAKEWGEARRTTTLPEWE